MEHQPKKITEKAIKWSEAFSEYLDRAIGVRGAPLLYVTQKDATPCSGLPPLADGAPHLVENGSIAKDLKSFAKHDHPLYIDDSEMVYFLLEQALR